MNDRAAPMTSGTVFQERYRIVRPIKSGGMGEVFEALDLRTSRPCAIKVMLAATLESADQRARFEQEARVTGGIDSEHVVRIFDAGVDGDRPFLVMELLRGEELQSILDRAGVLPVGEVILYLGQVARALEKTHAQSIIHRDLKPENLFVARRDDGSPCVKILDFGIAKVAAQSQAKQTRSLGTPLFMAPEQVLGEGSIAPNADLYALAHVAYCLLVGEPYWEEEVERQETVLPLLRKVIGGPVEPPTARARRRRGVSLPPGFDAWFTRAAAANPAMRFERATEQVDALRALLLPPIDHATQPATSNPLVGFAPQAFAARPSPAGQSIVTAAGFAPPGPATGSAATAAFSGLAPSALPSAAIVSRAATTLSPPTLAAPPPGAHTTQAGPLWVANAVTGDVRPPVAVPAPPARRGVNPVLVIVGVLALLGVVGGGVAIALLLHKGPDSKAEPSASARASAPPRASASAPVATPSVVASAPPTSNTWAPDKCYATKCAPIDVPDTTAADPSDVLVSLTKLAKEMDPSAVLRGYTVISPQPNGVLDLTARETMASATFGGERGLLTISAVRNQMLANISPTDVPGPTLATPCPFKNAFRAATAKSTQPIRQIGYQIMLGHAVWMFLAGNDMVLVDAATCEFTLLE